MLFFLDWGCNCSVAPPGYEPGFNKQHPQATFIHHILSTFYPLLLVLFIICPLFVRFLATFCLHFVHLCSFSTFLSAFCPLLVYFLSTFSPFPVHFLSFSVKFLPTFCPMFIFCPFLSILSAFVQILSISISIFPLSVHFCPFIVQFLSISFTLSIF